LIKHRAVCREGQLA